jgi:hypothetical protein
MKLWILYRVGRTPWTGDQPVARPLPTQNKTEKNADIHTSSGIRTYDQMFEQAKTFRESDRAATLIGILVTFPLETFFLTVSAKDILITSVKVRQYTTKVLSTQSPVDSPSHLQMSLCFLNLYFLFQGPTFVLS